MAMKLKSMLLLAVACAACVGWMHRPVKSQEAKRVIGPTETVAIADAEIGLVARVDTGARTTSVHAESIELMDDEVRFDLVCPDGRRVPMQRPVAEVRTVRSAAGSEDRVFVELTLEHDGYAKPVLVNLKDRSHMAYPLLLGRNWLKDDYIVDVSREPVVPAKSAGTSMRLVSRD